MEQTFLAFTLINGHNIIIALDKIVSICAEANGTCTITTTNGEYWFVKESFDEITELFYGEGEE